MGYFYMCLIIDPNQYLFMVSTPKGKKVTCLSHANKHNM